MSDFNISGQRHHDLSGSRGNGPFQNFLGVVLHVNVSGRTSNGTDPSFYAAGSGINPDSVCPNWQVMRDGTAWKMLPANWQPWTQSAGNYNYASIETGGDPDMPLTAAQIATCGRIIAGYHQHMGMPLTIINRPGLRGFGTHSMGGQAWGGHPCPGAIRSRQRSLILDAARGHRPTPPDFLEQIMALNRNSADYKALVADIAAAVWAQPIDAQNINGKPVKWRAGAILVDAREFARRVMSR